MALAETPTPGVEDQAPATAQQTVAEVTPLSRFTGMIELRPTWNVAEGKLGTENTIDVGYQFTERFSMDYNQYFNTNVSDPTGAVGDLGAYAHDGFLRAKLKNVWQSASKDLSLQYESRLYLPTFAARRDAGMVAALRNYFSLVMPVNSWLTVTLQEIPILYGFNRAGTYGKAPGEPGSANAIFENRVYLIGTFQIAKGISFDLPIMAWATRHRDFLAGATNNSAWSYMLMMWPELDFSVDENSVLGVSFYTDNLLNGNVFGGDGGFAKGFMQFVYRVTL